MPLRFSKKMDVQDVWTEFVEESCSLLCGETRWRDRAPELSEGVIVSTVKGFGNAV